LRTSVRIRHNLLDLICRDDSLVAVEKMVCIVFLVAFLFVIVIVLCIVDSYRESAPALPKPTFGSDALQAPRQMTRSQVLDGLFDSIAGVFSSVQHVWGRLTWFQFIFIVQLSDPLAPLIMPASSSLPQLVMPTEMSNSATDDCFPSSLPLAMTTTCTVVRRAFPLLSPYFADFAMSDGHESSFEALMGRRHSPVLVSDCWKIILGSQKALITSEWPIALLIQGFKIVLIGTFVFPVFGPTRSSTSYRISIPFFDSE
jgi:hypothetical protein